MGKVNLHLEKAEENALDSLVELRLFSSRDEAARAAILKYAMDIGIIGRQTIWQEIDKVKKRKVTPEQLKKDLEILEDED